VSKLLQRLNDFADSDRELLTRALVDTPSTYAQSDRLHQILWLETSAASGRTHPEWYLAWERFGHLIRTNAAPRSSTDYYLEAVNFAAQQAHAVTLLASDQASRSQPLVLSLRYRLITASVTSLAKNLPLPILIALAQEERWDYQRAITYVREIPEEGRRAEAVIALAQLAGKHESICQQLVDVIRNIQDAQHQIAALTGVAPYLPFSSYAQLVNLCTDRALSGFPRERWADVIAALAPALPPDLRTPALEAATRLTAQEGRYRALLPLAPMLEPEGLEKVIELLDRDRSTLAVHHLRPQHQSVDDWHALGAAVAMRLAALGMSDRAFQSVSALRPDKRRIITALRLLRDAPEHRRQATLREVYQASLWLQQDSPNNFLTHDPEVLIEAIPYLPTLICPTAIEIVIQHWDLTQRAWFFNRLPAPCTEPWCIQVYRQALNALYFRRDRTGRFDNIVWRTRAILALIPLLPHELLADALAVARLNLAEELNDIENRKEPTSADDDDKWAGWDVTSGDFRRSLARHLAASTLADCLESLILLAHRSPEQLLPSVLAEVDRISDPLVRLAALAELAPHLPAQAQRAVLALAIRLQAAKEAPGEGSTRDQIAVATAKLAQAAPEQMRDTLFTRARNLLTALGNDNMLAAGSQIVGLLPSNYLPPLLDRAIQASEEIGDQRQQAGFVAALFSAMPFEHQSDVIDEVVDFVSSTYEWRAKDSQVNRWIQADREHVLAQLTPILARHGRLDDALGVINEQASDQRIESLVTLIPAVEVARRDELFITARRLAEQTRSTDRWVLLASRQSRYLSEAQRLTLLTLAQKIDDHHRRAEALAELIACLPDKQQELARGYLAAYVATHEQAPLPLLAAIVPHISTMLSLDWKKQITYSLTENMLNRVGIPQLDSPHPSRPAINPLQDPEGYMQATSKTSIEESHHQFLAVPKQVGALRTLEESLGFSFMPAMPALIQSAHEVSELWRRVILFSSAVPHMPESARSDVANAAFDAYGETGELFDAGASLQIMGLLAPYLDHARQLQALQIFFQAIGMLISTYEREPIAIDALRNHVASLGLVNDQRLYDAWRQFLDTQSQISRRRLFLALWATLPIGLQLGGNALATELFYAVRKVSRWWP